MKKLKNKLISAFFQETPSLSEKIQKRCENEHIEPFIQEEKKQKFYKKTGFKRSLLAISMAFIFIIGLTLGNFINFNKTAKSSSSEMYIDVNPSIKLEISNYETVKTYSALNNDDDATNILSELDLKNVKVTTALYAIIGAMLSKGYLTEQSDTNSILISVSGSEKGQTDFLNKVVDNVNGLFSDDNKCSIIAQRITPTEDVKKRAKENKISVGKMALVDKIIGADDSFKDRQNDFAKKSIKELSVMYNNFEKDKNDGDVIRGNEVLEKEGEVFNKVLQKLGVDKTIVRGEELSIIYDNGVKIYKISFETHNGERKFYKYNSLTEEVTEDFPFYPPDKPNPSEPDQPPRNKGERG